MKKTRIIWGIAIIAAALLLMLDFFGVASGLWEGVAVWKIVLAVLFLLGAINEIIKLKFHGAIIPLAFIIILFEKEIALLSMFVEQTQSPFRTCTRTGMQQTGIGTQHGRFSGNAADEHNFPGSLFGNGTHHADAEISADSHTSAVSCQRSRH